MHDDWSLLSTFVNWCVVRETFRLRLDVDIGALSIELVSMPNHTSIGIGL